MNRLLRIIAAGSLTLLGAGAANAQAYPAKPITIVTAFGPGSASDTITRVVAQPLGVALKQSVIVEARPGANGAISAMYVARAQADGYTLLMVASSFTVVPATHAKLPYDPEHDFQPISPNASAPLPIVARKSIAANDLKELIAWLKASPYQATQGTGGVAATSHIAGIFFQQVSGTRFTLVPYRGAGPAITAPRCRCSRAPTRTPPSWRRWPTSPWC